MGPTYKEADVQWKLLTDRIATIKRSVGYLIKEHILYSVVQESVDHIDEILNDLITFTEKQIGEDFNVVLTDVGIKTIQVIKLVRELTGKGLRDSKEIVDNVNFGDSPMCIGTFKLCVASDIRDRFIKVGATVSIEGVK